MEIVVVYFKIFLFIGIMYLNSKPDISPGDTALRCRKFEMYGLFYLQGTSVNVNLPAS